MHIMISYADVCILGIEYVNFFLIISFIILLHPLYKDDELGWG